MLRPMNDPRLRMSRATHRVPASHSALVVCPVSRHPLAAGDDGLHCIDASCGRRFPVVDGVPILIGVEDGPIAIDEFSLSPPTPRPKSHMHALALQWLPTLEGNVAAARVRSLVTDLLFARTSSPVVLNLGGKHGSAALSPLRAAPGVQCIEVDPVLGSETSLVADLRALPFGDAVFDAVIADAVLEHASDAAAVAAEIGRVIRPAGILYSDVPFLLGVHGGRFDFGRFTQLAHRRLFADFEEIESGVSAGPGSALANMIQSFLLTFVTARRARFAIKSACRLGLFWIKYFDGLLARRPGAADAALGTYFVGRKSEHRTSDRELVAAYRGATPDLYGMG
jgi:SAM-dependent methyltransferase/uncharacterized protein YbaR (Trm112 family)